MTIAKNNLPLKMVRANLDHVPEFTLPAGFTLRWYEPGDEAHWLRIHLAADPFNEITPELFRKQFAPDAGRGLAKPLMTSICRRLRELGHEHVYLSTSTARRAAIGLYLKFGFAPVIRSEEDGAAWREVLPLVVRRV